MPLAVYTPHTRISACFILPGFSSNNTVLDYPTGSLMKSATLHHWFTYVINYHTYCIVFILHTNSIPLPWSQPRVMILLIPIPLIFLFPIWPKTMWKTFVAALTENKKEHWLPHNVSPYPFSYSRFPIAAAPYLYQRINVSTWTIHEHFHPHPQLAGPLSTRTQTGSHLCLPRKLHRSSRLTVGFCWRLGSVSRINAPGLVYTLNFSFPIR